MKILVAGGAGYIGSVMIPRLLERGYNVDVIDLFWFGNHLPDEVGTINKDIFDLKEEDVKDYDQVIFVGGLSNDPMAEFSPAENFISNASAPAFLAYTAKKAGVKRFIYAGSCSVYGYTVNELYDETNPAVSVYPYGISKLQGENAALQMADKDFSVIAFRQGTVSGYSPRMRLDLVVNTMFKFAVTEKVINVNNPAIWRPILAIKDAATAYTRAVEANEDISGIFNIASGNYTVGEIGDLVKSGVKKYLDLDVKLNIKHIQDYRNYKVSIDKARKVLSFHPQHDVESIIQDLVENKDKFADFSSPNFYNIQVFKNLKK
ncbi:MAG: NAD(P)-dependent oxidoreductase [Candidatus Aminicenantes bacterium]|nr:NAD(P)-dependent oxidoreductase [Candidatus Aminicenantes bacterium]